MLQRVGRAAAVIRNPSPQPGSKLGRRGTQLTGRSEAYSRCVRGRGSEFVMRWHGRCGA